MARILQINDDIISIGLDNGTIKEVRTADLNFTPKVDDEVEVFESQSKILVSKVKSKAKAEDAQNGGVNINISNANNTPNYHAAPGQSGTVAVNKVVYCLLAFFLGFIGIHKFYAGKTAAGILYLLFCWTYIPSLIAFIEFIIGLCKQSDAQGRILV